MDFFEKHEISRPSRPFTERDFNSRIPRYNDDSDYTTNAPSYYDDLARKNKLLKTLSYRIWEYQEVINKQFNEWDEQIKEYFLEWQKNLEEFDEEVMKLLRQWMEDGTMADLINETLLNMKADKEYVDDEFLKVNTELGKKVNKADVSFNIKDFGALGDGVTDDTQSLKDAISHIKNLGGGDLYIPRGEYMISDVITLPDNISIEGAGDLTVIKPLNYSSILFRADGTFSDTTALIQNAGLGSHFVTVSDETPFKVGDFIRIVGQRIAYSYEDAGERWVLGANTSSNDKVYFGEYKRISAIIGKELYFRGALQYPDFLTHGNNETHEHARNTSTVDKVNHVSNITLKNFVVDGGFSQVSRFDITRNVLVDNVKWINSGNGRLTSFIQSFMCEARNCKIEYSLDIPDGGVYSRNGFGTTSSLLCGFDNVEVHNGTQCVDFSYSGNDIAIPDHNSYLTNSRIYAPLYAGATSHGLTVSPRFTDNIIINSRQDGIVNRSRNALIDGNIIKGSPSTDVSGFTYGVALNQAGAQDCIVTNNQLSGFTVALAVTDSLNSPVRYSGALFENNHSSLQNRGVVIRRVKQPINTRSHIKIKDNFFTEFTGVSGRAVDIYEYFRYIEITGNTFNANNTVSGGIYSRGESYDFFIKDNHFINAGRVVWFEDVTDTDLFGTGTKRYTFNEGNVSNAVIDFSHQGNLIKEVTRHYNSVRPYEDDVYNLGYSSNRWSQIFATSGVISTSDRNYKDNIETSELGLKLIEKLNPVTFNFKNGNRKHYGLIAQDVEKVINDMGINTDDFAVITKDENGYGMRYTEMIPILINAIKELNDKIK